MRWFWLLGVSVLLCCQGMLAVAQRPGRLPQRRQAQRPVQTPVPQVQRPVEKPAEDPLGAWIARLESSLPGSAAEFSALNEARITESSGSIEKWAADLATLERVETPDDFFRTLEHLIAGQQRVDVLLDRMFALRVQFVKVDEPQRRQAINAYLRTMTGLIDLAGRLRYSQTDAIRIAAIETSASPQARERLLDLLIRYRSPVGAAVMASSLTGTAESTERPASTDERLQSQVLTLIAKSRQLDALPAVVQLIQSGKPSPRLVLQAAETIREVGLPQDARPQQDPTLPRPAITAAELHDLLAALQVPAEESDLASRRDELVRWLDLRAKHGLTEASYRLGDMEVRPGDWLLMRNPSPYNLFTDLSPGLFTHVGVVALEEGSDGVQRMVIVDMPEKGNRMPATNVDVFVQRTLHYVFLRHRDPSVGATMGRIAASTIDAPTEFDLNFHTARVQELQGQDLKGRKIHTYCAGFLLLCAQETGVARSEFFPLPEAPAGGHTRDNLAGIGITFGGDFVSPTGGLFAPALEIVGRRAPTYDPRREVEEAIFDHFASSLVHQKLTPTHDLFQSLRMKIAAAADTDPRLTAALVQALDAPVQSDLASAAKAAAVVETLDEIAFRNSGEFLAARAAILGQSTEGDSEDIQADARKRAEMRSRHADLAARWERGDLTPRALRLALVRFYIERGKSQLDQRFFGGSATPKQDPASVDERG